METLAFGAVLDARDRCIALVSVRLYGTYTSYNLNAQDVHRDVSVSSPTYLHVQCLELGYSIMSDVSTVVQWCSAINVVSRLIACCDRTYTHSMGANVLFICLQRNNCLAQTLLGKGHGRTHPDLARVRTTVFAGFSVVSFTSTATLLGTSTFGRPINRGEAGMVECRNNYQAKRMLLAVGKPLFYPPFNFALSRNSRSCDLKRSGWKQGRRSTSSPGSVLSYLYTSPLSLKAVYDLYLTLFEVL